MVKKILFIAALTSLTFCFAEGTAPEREIVKVSLPYPTGPSPKQEWTIYKDSYGREISYFGLSWDEVEVEALDASAKIGEIKTSIQKICTESGMLAPIVAKNISTWSESVAEIVAWGLEEQDRKDQEYMMKELEWLVQEGEEQADAYAMALDEYAEFKATTTSQQTALQSQISSLTSLINTQKNNLDSAINDANTRIANTSTQIASLEARQKAGEKLTSDELKRLSSLKADLASLNHVKSMAEVAKSAAEMANAELKNTNRKLDNYIDYDFFAKQINLVSKFFGYNGLDVRSVFFPQKVIQGEPAQGWKAKKYNPANGETILDYLSDNGVVAYKTLGMQESDYWPDKIKWGFIETDAETDPVTGEVHTNNQANFRMPTNWSMLGRDVASIDTNVVEALPGKSKEVLELRDFHTLNNKANPSEYDYLPNATYKTDSKVNPPKIQYVIDWQTNDLAAVKKALGLKKSPKKSQLSNLTGSLLDEFFDDGGLVQKVIGETGVVERLNKAINIANAWDNKSVWTNGEDKVEIKEYSNTSARKSYLDIPVRKWPYDDVQPGVVEWHPFTQGDADLEDTAAEVKSIETKSVTKDGEEYWMFGLYGFEAATDGYTLRVKQDKDNLLNRELAWDKYFEPDSDITATSSRKSIENIRIVDTDGDVHETLSLYGFDDTSRETGAVPYLYGYTARELKWADPPDGVSASAPKVLTFDGSTVAWDDAAGGGSALAFYGWDGTAETGPYIVGSGMTTNVVKFSSATDSNVKIDISTTTKSIGGASCLGVDIKIGVYYK